jgi:hypothetical protein
VEGLLKGRYIGAGRLAFGFRYPFNIFNVSYQKDLQAYASMLLISPHIVLQVFYSSSFQVKLPAPIHGFDDRRLAMIAPQVT